MRFRYLLTSVITFFLVIIEGFLGMRFLLKLFGANPNTGFVSWVYEMSAGLLDPFRGIFPIRVYENRFIFEFSTLFAMLVYALLGFGLIALVNGISHMSNTWESNPDKRQR